MLNRILKRNQEEKVSELELFTEKNKPYEEDPYSFNLYDKKKKSPNLIAIGASGAGKTTLFKNIIKEEHNQYSNITSVVICEHNSNYITLMPGTIIYKAHDFIINPFSSFSEHTRPHEQIERLFSTIAIDCEMPWTKSHSKEIYNSVQDLMAELNETTPIMDDLHKMLFEKFITLNKENIQYSQSIHEQSVEQLLAQHKTNSYTKLLNDLSIYNDLLSIADMFVLKESTYSKWFNGQTVMPDIPQNAFIVIEPEDNFHFDTAFGIFVGYVTSYLQHHRSFEDGYLSIYHDLSGEFFDNEIYNRSIHELLSRYLFSQNQIGIRVTTQPRELSKGLLSWFGNVLYFNIPPLYESNLNLSATERNLVFTLEQGECYWKSRKMFLVKSKQPDEYAGHEYIEG